MEFDGSCLHRRLSEDAVVLVSHHGHEHVEFRLLLHVKPIVDVLQFAALRPGQALADVELGRSGNTGLDDVTVGVVYDDLLSSMVTYCVKAGKVTGPSTCLAFSITSSIKARL